MNLPSELNEWNHMRDGVSNSIVASSRVEFGGVGGIVHDHTQSNPSIEAKAFSSNEFGGTGDTVHDHKHFKQPVRVA